MRSGNKEIPVFLTDSLIENQGWTKTTETFLLKEVGFAVEKLVSITLPWRYLNFCLSQIGTKTGLHTMGNHQMIQQILKPLLFNASYLSRMLRD